MAKMSITIPKTHKVHGNKVVKSSTALRLMRQDCSNELPGIGTPTSSPGKPELRWSLRRKEQNSPLNKKGTKEPEGDTRLE